MASSSFRLRLLTLCALVGALGASAVGTGCSAIVSPDPNRLGREGTDASVPPGVDADIRPPDAFVPAVDAYVPPGTDAFVPPGTDAFVPPMPDAWVPPMVDAGCSGPPVCSGTTLTRCEDGVAISETCPLGCADATRCAEMVPSNIEPGLLAEGTRDLSVTTMAVFDTMACMAMSVGSRVVTQGDGSEVCVLVVRDLRIAPEASLRVTGTRPLVIAASGEVVIDGLLDVSARGIERGPGGGAGGLPARPDGQGPAGGTRGQLEGTYPDGGGGGGGGCGDGGDGGSGGGADGGEGGAGRMTTLEPLVGGSGGGLGPGGLRSGASGNAGFGGGGGGAVQISARVAIRMRGRIFAGGGGGGAGGTDDRFTNWGAGGGGGAGGGILLESPVLELLDGAALLASGGGGGSGGNRGTPLAPGQDGRSLPGRASGGTGGGTYGASGGDSGGGADADALDGLDNDNGGANGGGGGGGVGCVVLRSPSMAPLPGTVRLSPSDVGLARLPLRSR
jgi:hypothetical protein